MMTDAAPAVNGSNRLSSATHTKAAPKPTPKKKPAKRKATRRTPRTTKGKRLDQFRTIITVSLGVAIPALSLALSHIAGTLGRQGHSALAAFSGACGVSVLVVSLSHLAEAIEDITSARTWQAWLLAVTLDLSIIACELVEVYAADAGLLWWCRGLMLVVAGFSMALNVYAFLTSRK